MLNIKDKIAMHLVTNNKETVIGVDQEVSVVAMGGMIQAMVAMVNLEFKVIIIMYVLKDQRIILSVTSVEIQLVTKKEFGATQPQNAQKTI
jgi:hypothetical protein